MPKRRIELITGDHVFHTYFEGTCRLLLLSYDFNKHTPTIAYPRLNIWIVGTLLLTQGVPLLLLGVILLTRDRDLVLKLLWKPTVVEGRRRSYPSLVNREMR